MYPQILCWAEMIVNDYQSSSLVWIVGEDEKKFYKISTSFLSCADGDVVPDVAPEDDSVLWTCGQCYKTFFLSAIYKYS